MENTVRNVESQPRANIASDHYPQKVAMQIRLKAKEEHATKTAPMYEHPHHKKWKHTTRP